MSRVPFVRISVSTREKKATITLCICRQKITAAWEMECTNCIWDGEGFSQKVISELYLEIL
jgi:hypothetical protein